MERREKERHARLVAAKKTGKTVFQLCLNIPRAHHTRPRLIYVTQNKYTRGRAYVQRGRIKENKYGTKQVERPREARK